MTEGSSDGVFKSQFSNATTVEVLQVDDVGQTGAGSANIGSVARQTVVGTQVQPRETLIERKRREYIWRWEINDRQL